MTDAEGLHWFTRQDYEREIERLRTTIKALENALQYGMHPGGDLATYEQCAIVAETEPEPDGPMPIEFNRENINCIVRATVRATRKAIAARIRRAALEPR